MGTSRAHIAIRRPADVVWAEVTDPTRIKDWFPGVTGCTLEGGVRRVLAGAFHVDELIVTNDSARRRFQYRIVPGSAPVDEHLATIDVLEAEDSALVIYSVDASPDSFAEEMQPMLEGALASLKNLLEE
jgi:uncharacterized protein YndB with AHSA1/START domain